MSQAPQSQSQAQHTPRSQAPGPVGDPKLAAMGEKLERMRQRLATTLDEDSLAELQAVVVELASMAGHPPGLAQPVPTPAPDAAQSQGHPGAPVPPPAPPR